MNYNIGDLLFSCGEYKEISIKDVARTDYAYLDEHLTLFPNSPEQSAIIAYTTGLSWINRVIPYSQKLERDCTLFALKVAPTMIDRVKSQGNQDIKLSKLQMDIIDGKLGEWVCYYMLSAAYGKITTPDMKTYTKEQKIFKPNLVSTHIGQTFSVHTQKMRTTTEESWIFGANDPEVKGEIDPLTKELFVKVDREQQVAMIRGLVNLGTLHKNNWFEEPDDIALRGYKKAVKYKTIKTGDLCEL